MRSTLVLLAHHDDEFFLAPLLRDECAGGTRVTVAFLTHGSAYGVASGIRVQESAAALSRLGVAEAGILQLGVERGIFDGQLSLKPRAGLDALQQHFRPGDFQRIYLMAWEGGHPDHDAAHRIGAAFAAGGAAELLEFPVYNACGVDAGRFHNMRLVPRAGEIHERRLTAEEARDWLALMACYPSQAPVLKPMLPSIEHALFRRGSCVYRRLAPLPDYQQRPHPGTLLYESVFKLPFETFRQRLQAL